MDLPDKILLTYRILLISTLVFSVILGQISVQGAPPVNKEE